MGSTHLNITGLVVDRGGKRVLAGGAVSVQLPGVALCTGPNGAGKTTLLEAVAGIIPVAGGTVELGGHAAQVSADEWRSRVTYLPSDGGTIPILTVREQLRLVMELCGTGREESARRIERLSAVFGLDHALDTRAESLSTGTRKRLGIALAMATPADLVLMDEPSAGLDSAGVRTLVAVLDAVRIHTTVIVTSHTAGVFLPVTDVTWRIEPGGAGANLVMGPPTGTHAADHRGGLPTVAGGGEEPGDEGESGAGTAADASPDVDFPWLR